jgi:glycosyltransferase involved in cell wall biosynthesis
MAGRLLSIARAYFSLEIWVSAEIRQRHWLWVKWLERVCNRSCRFTIVQDEDRARLLMAENHIPQSQVVLVPNSFLGPPTKRKTVYLYQKLGIPADKKIILHAGSLQHWTMALELVEAAHDWPDEWALVLQSRQHLGTGEYDICLRSKIDSQHVFLCGDPVPSREMSDLVASGDIGVALYRTGPSHVLGANQLWAGLGSGKIASYLHHGLPVVTVNFPSLTQLVEGCACGKVVPDAGAVGRAIAEILADYPTYSANALCCYQERFDFEQAFEQVLQRLGEIS